MVACSTKDASESMVYSYRHGFSGFAAHLTDSQAKTIAGTYVYRSTIDVDNKKYESLNIDDDLNSHD